jgi:hypothetical protein
VLPRFLAALPCLLAVLLRCLPACCAACCIALLLLVCFTPYLACHCLALCWSSSDRNGAAAAGRAPCAPRRFPIRRNSQSPPPLKHRAMSLPVVAKCLMKWRRGMSFLELHRCCLHVEWGERRHEAGVAGFPVSLELLLCVLLNVVARFC